MCIFSQDMSRFELLGDFTQAKSVKAFWPIPCRVHIKVKQYNNCHSMYRQKVINFTCNIILNTYKSYI